MNKQKERIQNEHDRNNINRKRLKSWDCIRKIQRIHHKSFIRRSSRWFKKTWYGVAEENIDVVKVPGAFEIPYMAKQLTGYKKYDAIIGLGTVIRGATTHYDYVCNEAAKGIASVSLETNVPIIFGVVTTESIEQAIERAGTKAGNKGYDSAVAAIEMANLHRLLEK